MHGLKEAFHKLREYRASVQITSVPRVAVLIIYTIDICGFSL